MSEYQGEKFRQYLRTIFISAPKAAEMLGVSKQTVYQYFKSTNLSREVVNRILTVFNTNEREVFQTTEPSAKIIGPVDEPLAPYEKLGNATFNELNNGQLLMIVRKVTERAYMGYLTGWADPEYIEDLEYHTLVVNKRHRGYYMAFEAVGQSMENYTSEEMAKASIPDRSTVTGREIQKHLWKSKFHNHRWPDFIFVHDDGILIKRLIDHDVENGMITLQSLNPDKSKYPDKSYSLDEMKQIFNVVHVSNER